MNGINSLVEALKQYDKILAKEYKVKMSKGDFDKSNLENEIESIIKQKRWEISDNKRKDIEFIRHFERYFVDREDV